MPEVGETVELDDGTKLTTVEMDKNHLEQIRMELPEIKDEESEDDEDKDEEEGGDSEEEANN